MGISPSQLGTDRNNGHLLILGLQCCFKQQQTFGRLLKSEECTAAVEGGGECVGEGGRNYDGTGDDVKSEVHTIFLYRRKS